MNDNSDSYIVDKFSRFNTLLFRISLYLMGISFFFFGLFLLAIDQLAIFVDLWVSLFLFGMGASVLNFFLAIIRIFKYLFSIRKLEDSPTIWRSTLILVFSPISFIILYLLIFMAALSSCGT